MAFTLTKMSSEEWRRSQLIAQVLDIFPALDVQLKGNELRILNGDRLLVGFKGNEQVRNALVTGFLSGVVKGFSIPVALMTDPENLASGKLSDN